MSRVRRRASLHIAVLCGGGSSERSISLRSGKTVSEALTASGYRVTVLDPSKRAHLMRLMRGAKVFDVAFLALHGSGGEDGTIQGFLESVNLPYTGSGVLASALALDKVRAKDAYKSHGITTPSYFEIDRAQWRVDGKRSVIAALRSMMAKGDLIVKPVSSGSSVATALVSKSKDLHKAIETALAADPEGRCLVEPRIVGRELTVAVLGNRVLEALPVIEIRPKAAFFDIESKYDSKMCDELCPAPIPKNVAKAAQNLAKRAHVVLGCRGYSRSDIIWDVRKDKLYVLETNTLPGMTATSLMPKASQAAGLAFIGLLERMIELAQEPRHI